MSTGVPANQLCSHCLSVLSTAFFLAGAAGAVVVLAAGAVGALVVAGAGVGAGAAGLVVCVAGGAGLRGVLQPCSTAAIARQEPTVANVLKACINNKGWVGRLGALNSQRGQQRVVGL
jgi:hypothetical protein